MPTARYEYFGKLLEPGLREIFYERYKEIPSMLSEIFNMVSTTNPSEQDVGVGTMGDFPKFEGTVEYDRPYQGYHTVYEFPEYAKGFRIERKLYDDERYSIINKRPKALATSAYRRREADGAAIFNNAFVTPGADGVALCSENHPTTAPDGPPTRSNMSQWKLSHDAVSAVRKEMRATLDDRGGKISVQPDTIVVPPDLEEKAWAIITADGKLDATHPGTNPNIHQGKYTLIVWDYLDNPDAWFMLDSHYTKMNLNWFDRVSLEFAMEEEFDTLVAKYRAYMRYTCGWSDWIGVFGNTGETDINGGGGGVEG